MTVTLCKILLLSLLVDSYFLYGNSMNNANGKKFEGRQWSVTRFSSRRTIMNNTLTSTECCMICINITSCDAYQFAEGICIIYEGVQDYERGGTEYIYFVTTLLEKMDPGSSAKSTAEVLAQVNEPTGFNISNTTSDEFNSTTLTTASNLATLLTTNSNEESTTGHPTTNLSSVETTTEEMNTTFFTNATETPAMTSNETTSVTVSEGPFPNISILSTTSRTSSTTTPVFQRSGFENYYKNRWSKVIFTRNQQYTWNQANSECNFQQEGSHLYIIHDADDAEWLANKLYWCAKDFGVMNFWIGLIMDPRFSRYPIWVDGSEAKTTCRRFAEYVSTCTLPTKYLSRGYAIQESESTFKIHAQRVLDPLNAFVCQFISWESNG